MIFVKFLTLTVAIIFSYCPVSQQDFNKIAECYPKCREANKEAEAKGELLCIEPTMGNGQKIYEPASKCVIECMDEQPPEDQNGCFANFCKNAGAMTPEFCTGPGEGSIKPDECDSMVGTGKAKMFGEEICKKKE